MKAFVFVDRDGTIIHDDRYYLGSTDDWKKKIKILPGVIAAIKKLKKAGALVYMISNQSGVAMKSLPLLTEKRAHEVCEYVMKMLENEGAEIDGCRICIHVDEAYVAGHREITFDTSLVKTCDCRKPAIGMIKGIMEERKLRGARVYVVGDRASDVKAALNAGGTGILVPFEGARSEGEKVKAMKNRSALIMENMEDAADFIVENEAGK